MRYIGLAEAYLIAEAVTGIDAHDLVRISRSDLLDSALHAPQAGFGTTDFFPTLIEKAAVLCIRIARNHPLPDGNKRLAWMSMMVFLELNGKTFNTSEEDAVTTMLAVAAGEISQADLTRWLTPRVVDLDES